MSMATREEPRAELLTVPGNQGFWPESLKEKVMNSWAEKPEFLACGLLVLPATLGIGLDNFEVFAISLALMLLALIGVTLGAPAVPAKEEKDDGNPHSSS